MCLESENHTQLLICPHGTFHLRVGNTSMHLSREQIISIYDKLNRYMHSDIEKSTRRHMKNDFREDRFGQSLN